MKQKWTSWKVESAFSKLYFDNITLLGWIHFPKFNLEKNILYYKPFATFYIKYGEKPFKKTLK